MIALGATLLRYLSPTVLVAAAVLIFYEGLPLGPIRWIPFVGPALEEFTDGRVDRARKAGAQDERLVWQERVRRIEAKHAEEERALQASLDAIAERYREDQRTRGDIIKQLEALEAALAEEEKHAPSTPGRGPSIRGRVSKQLDRIGR